MGYLGPCPFVSLFWFWDDDGFVRCALMETSKLQDIFMILSDMYTGIGHAIGDLGEKKACQDHSDHS